LAEHGLSLYIELFRDGERHVVLLDGGFTAVSLPHNLQRMELDPASVELAVLSHGHLDHATGIREFLQMAGRPMPLLVHPEAFRERWHVLPDGRRIGPRQVPRAEWEAAGARLLFSDGPYRVLPGCWATGPIPRRTDFERGMHSAHYRVDDELLKDDIPDDQALVMHLRGRGLLVVSGCAHAGIVNTICYAQELAGVPHIAGIFGGLHLAGNTPADTVARTIAELKDLSPEVIVPTHCTGFASMSALAREMPEAFVLNAVGTSVSFCGSIIQNRLDG
jgi:7,8-dihydropterin-6-yl-methyl-4-(beta-D-ribofuranosyl)aminobenzene 5'-phosphate synthase